MKNKKRKPARKNVPNVLIKPAENVKAKSSRKKKRAKSPKKNRKQMMIAKVLGKFSKEQVDAVQRKSTSKIEKFH